MRKSKIRQLEGVFVMASPAGGAGRTSLALGLGATLANFGVEVLMMDLDPRGSLSFLLGLEPDERWGGVLEALARPDEALEAVTETGYPHLSLLASDVLSTAEDTQLEATLADWKALPRCLERLRSRYQVIIIDAPAGTSRPARVAMSSADEVLIPLVACPLAVRGLPRLLQAVADSRRPGSITPQLAGIVLNRVQARAPLFPQILSDLKSQFAPLLLETAIPYDPWFVEAAARAMPVPSLLPEAPASMAMMVLLREIAKRRLQTA